MNTNKAPSLAKVIMQAFTFLIITLGIVAISAGYIWLGFQLYHIMAGFVIPNATKTSEGLAFVTVIVMILAPVVGGFTMDTLNRWWEARKASYSKGSV